MSAASSIAVRLTRLALTGLVGAVVMTLLLVLDFEPLVDKDGLTITWPDKWLRTLLYVLLPFVALTTSMIIVGRRISAEISALNDLLGRLDELAANREVFAAQAAHELKTPLAILMLELDQMGTPDSLRLKGDVQKMSRLLDQLSLMAQLDSSVASPLDQAAVNLAEIAAEVVESLVPHAIALGLRLEINVRDNRSMAGRREALSAALRNLIENALRVTPLRGVVTVTVGPGLRIAVRDGGPGLTDAELNSLIKPFARAGNPSVNGAGLGLAIVAQIVRFHGGQIATVPKKRELEMTFSRKQNDTENFVRHLSGNSVK